MIGTIQLVFFKQFWCERFTDTQLMLGGLTLFAVAQLLVINWGPVSNSDFLHLHTRPDKKITLLLFVF